MKRGLTQMKNEFKVVGNDVEITLKSNKYGDKTLYIDLEDLPRLEEAVGNRSISMKKGTGKEKFYASFTSKEGKHTFIHRFVMDYEGELLVDHINGDGLNDRKSNLRLATHSENAQNIENNANSQSGIKGLVYDPDKKKWRVRIKLDGKVKYEHFFRSKEKAIEVLNRKLDKYHEFRRQLED
jgi:hypothetical protein